MLERLIAAGYGGQGLMFTGKLIAWAMMNRGFQVTYIPSYGAEVRGGTANCHVVVSSERIHSPIVEEADSLLIMNEPSLARYADTLAKGGRIFLNTSMVAADKVPAGRTVVAVPATEIASSLGDVRVANMVMLGAYNAVKELLSLEALRGAVENATGSKGRAMLDTNFAAVERGAAAVRGA